MSQVRHPAAYVESWDKHDFPNVDERRAANKPAFLTERVELEWGLIPEADGHLVDGWIVTRGFLRVAHALHETTYDPPAFDTHVTGWIAEAHDKDERDQDWKRRWDDRLAVTPHILAALNDSPDALFDRANLTLPQRRAMLQFCAGTAGREAARRLGIDESTYREHRENAINAIKALD